MQRRAFRHLAALGLLVAIVSCGKPEEEQKPVEKPDDPTPQTEVKTPVIHAQNASLPARGGTYTIEVKVENPAEGASLKAVPTDEVTNFLGENITVIPEGLSVTVSDNLSAAKYTQLQLSYPGAESVTITVGQEQWKYAEFSIAMSGLGPFGATFDITRSAGYTGGYFFEVMDKKAVDKYLEGDTGKIGDFSYGEALYQSDLAYIQREADRMGHGLDQMLSMLGSMYSKNATVKVPYSHLATDTDYMFIVYGMEEGTAKRTTPIAFYQFHTDYSSESALSFTGNATDITENYATINIRPSNDEEWWYFTYVSSIDMAKYDLATIMQNSIDAAKRYESVYGIEEILCKGYFSEQFPDLMADTEYTVVAWGMNLKWAATTPPQVVFTFKTEEIPVADNCSFKIDVLEVEDMDICVRVTPSSGSTHYYTAFVEKSRMEGYDDNQAAQRIINMEAKRLDEKYYGDEITSWYSLPGVATGTQSIWGRRDYHWTFLPEHEYRVYVFGIDAMGIRSTVVEALDVTTAPAGESHNHFTVNFDLQTWHEFHYTVTPEIEDEFWMPFLIETKELAYCRNADGSLNEKEVMEQIEEYYEDEIVYHNYKGTRTIKDTWIPDTDYTLLVFGYAGTNTTQMYEWHVHSPAPPFNKSTADYSYSYELFRGEDLADLDPILWPHADFDGDCILVMRLNPTANAAHWYLGVWPPVENFAEQGGLYYLMTLDMDTNVAGSAMQDKKFFRTRPWWYGASEGYKWVDEDGDTVNHWPWSISGWAEDADGNYGPWHYELFIPIPKPKDEVTGKYEVGYTEAYNFWSSPAGASDYKVYRIGTNN